VKWLRSGALLAAIVLVPLAMMGFLQQLARSMIYPGSPVPFPSAAERMVLVGRSLGSGVATEMALRRRSALLVLISPYASMVDMGKQIAGPAANLMVPDRYDNLSKLPQVAAPVVILHGTRDEVVPVTMGRALAAAVPSAVFVEIPAASHNDFPGLEELVEREIGGAFRPR
jgi:pimeloyl-ACP methyl ester carboxylesterase